MVHALTRFNSVHLTLVPVVTIMMASINLAMNDLSLLECIVTYIENTAHIMF